MGDAVGVQVPDNEPNREITREVWTEDCYRFAGNLRGRTLIDVGANVGIATLAAIAHGAEGAVAIEPDAINRGLLVENLAANNATALVDVRAEACAGRHCSFIVRRPHSSDGCSGTSWTDAYDEPGANRVRALPLEEFVPLGAYDLVLKVDCEGAEYDLFAGAPSALLERFAAITIEYHHDPARGLDSYRRLPLLLAKLLVTHNFDVRETFMPGIGMVWATRRARQ